MGEMSPPKKYSEKSGRWGPLVLRHSRLGPPYGMAFLIRAFSASLGIQNSPKLANRCKEQGQGACKPLASNVRCFPFKGTLSLLVMPGPGPPHQPTLVALEKKKKSKLALGDSRALLLPISFLSLIASLTRLHTPDAGSRQREQHVDRKAGSGRPTARCMYPLLSAPQIGKPIAWGDKYLGNL